MESESLYMGEIIDMAKKPTAVPAKDAKPDDKVPAAKDAPAAPEKKPDAK